MRRRLGQACQVRGAERLPASWRDWCTRDSRRHAVRNAVAPADGAWPSLSEVARLEASGPDTSHTPRQILDPQGRGVDVCVEERRHTDR